ncbi:LIC12162 family transferase [Methylomonas methanica]|uniref:Transferase n=1 Tax=Methylomonas methanica (strain DSM 25384 / MC09) TaxID=857087 RepID=F9ZWB8_METMM|nr:LIC12162 family protein [Methylomonas methanica]AEF99587.1 hypothetical protein Metme_1159 [Methylomonas methanica MC09]
MKSNFVVSTWREIWLSDAKKLYAVDPNIIHKLECDGRLADYDEITVAPVLRSTVESFVQDHQFVDLKFRQHVDILMKRLDDIHGTNHGNAFWKKALSLSLLRHITLCYDLFKICENHLDLENHDCRILDQACFRIPGDFDEHRQIFQHSDLGQEQLFSIYCRLFYQDSFLSWQDDSKTNLCYNDIHNVQSANICLRIFRRLINKVKSVIRAPRLAAHKAFERVFRIRDPKIGIIDCSFSTENITNLLIKSRGRIQTISLPSISCSGQSPNWQQRDWLVSEEEYFDRFDRFSFACLRHGMPKIFIEDFSDVYNQLTLHFNRYRQLKWAACEWWIGHTLPSIAMAILGQKGVKHIYTEHNYLAYPFLGNNLKYIYPLVDEFISLGWEDRSIPNLIRGGSLFPWVEQKELIKEHEILFISSIPNTRAPEVNASYGESGARAVLAYLEMNRLFFDALSESTLKSMVYRAYPSSIASQAHAWDQTYVLRKYLPRVKLFDEGQISARTLMQRSRLIVVNYLSTSYLEALIADLPTIILWNENAYLLDERFEDFFDVLIHAQICHRDPVEAANFIEQIKASPEEWWGSPLVRHARESFLKANIGTPELLMKRLLDHVSE